MLAPRRAPLAEGITFEALRGLSQPMTARSFWPWDTRQLCNRAGAWVCANGRPIVTVAEYVEPRSPGSSVLSPCARFGRMEVIGVGKGDW